jgi:hypothetical protein
MKQVVFFLLVVLLPLCHPAQAQNPLVMSLFSAAQARSRAAQASRPFDGMRKQDAQAYTKVVSYEGEQFLYKRCPGVEHLQPGGAQIAQLEQFLDRRYAALLTDTLLVLSPALEAEYATLSKQVWVNQQWRQEVQAARQRRALRQAHRDSIARQALPQGVSAPVPPPARKPRE